MKKYQLIGRKTVLKRSLKPVDVTYPTAHIHSLPVEILLLIFSHVNSTKDYISLASCCKKFKNIIYKSYLYKSVTFSSSDKFYQFSMYHLPQRKKLARRLGLNESSSHINYVQSINIINPPKKDCNQNSTKIAGSYDVESVKQRNASLDYDDFVTFFLSLLHEGFGIKSLTLSEIPPQFAFPDITIKKDGFLRRRVSRTLENLILSSQTGWSIPFRFQHVSSILTVFDWISELTLKNFIIDEDKLLSPTPVLQKLIVIEKLTLISCKFTSLTKRLHAKDKSNYYCELFEHVRHLQLIKLTSGNDLSIIDFVKNKNKQLKELTIDLDSSLFFDFGGDLVKFFNFSKFNAFFKLVCSGNSYSSLTTLNLINFDLFDEHGHIRNVDQTPVDDWVNHEGLEKFLANLNSIPNLTIVLKNPLLSLQVCKKCGFVDDNKEEITGVVIKDWHELLKPLLKNEALKLRILNHTYNEVFTRV